MFAKKGSFLFFFHENTDKKKPFHRRKEKGPQLKMFDRAPVSPAVPPVGEAAVRFISLNESVIPEEDYLKDLGDV